MKIWKMTSQYDNYRIFNPTNDNDRKLFNENFNGVSMEQIWTTPTVKVYKDGVESDFPPGLLSTPVFSEEAIQVLKELLNDLVELLPINTTMKKQYYACNVLNVLDCIDENNFEAKRFRSGKIMKYTKFAFKKEAVKNQHIFKIVNHESKKIKATDVFVSDLFRETVIESGLKGFDFIEVWDSEKADTEENDSSKLVPTLDTSKETYSFEDATNLVEKQNKVIISESLEWAMRLGDEKQTQIGHLQEDGTYMWLNPIYYPPIFIEMKWRIVSQATKL